MKSYDEVVNSTVKPSIVDILPLFKKRKVQSPEALWDYFAEVMAEWVGNKKDRYGE